MLSQSPNQFIKTAVGIICKKYSTHLFKLCVKFTAHLTTVQISYFHTFADILETLLILFISLLDLMLDIGTYHISEKKRLDLEERKIKPQIYYSIQCSTLHEYKIIQCLEIFYKVLNKGWIETA